MKKELIFLLVFLTIILTGCTTFLKEKVTVENFELKELEDPGDHEFLVTLKNNDYQTAECDAIISLDEKSSGVIKVGLIKPNEAKTGSIDCLIETEETDIKIESQCNWPTKEELENCGDIEDIDKRRICYLTYNKPELEKCLVSEYSFGYQIFCMALVTGDTDYCNYISMPFKRYWCKAYVSEDFSQCDNIKNDDQRDWCYMDIGVNVKEEELCDKIKDEKKKMTCNAAIIRDADLCLLGDENYKSMCVANIAESKGDISLCDKLGESSAECYELFDQM